MDAKLLRIAGALCVTMGLQAAWSQDDPQALVRKTTDTVLDQVRAERVELASSPDRIYELVNEHIFPHFDFPRIGQYVLGSAWAGASAGEQQAFMEQFRRLLVRTYSRALLEFSNARITYGEVQQRPGAATATVSTHVQAGGNSLPIVYRMHNQDGDWQVLDVTVDGVSLVANYRASFAAEVNSRGLDGLIASLREKNAQPL